MSRTRWPRGFVRSAWNAGMTTNELANLAGVTPSTVYSLLDPKRRDVSILTIKKLCDGLEITLGAFFSTPEFDALEQEIR